MFKKKILISILTLISTLSIGLGSSLAIGLLNKSNNSVLSNSIINEQSTEQNVKTDEAKPLIPSQSTYYSAHLSSSNGPLLYWANTITSVDWFGAKRWSIDVENDPRFKETNFSLPSQTNWNRTWLNWDLDRKNDILYLLSQPKSFIQHVAKIDVSSGEVKEIFPVKVGRAYYGISILDGGTNGMIYCSPGHVTDYSVIFNTKTGEYQKESNGNLDTVSVKPIATESGHDYTNSYNYLMNLIPIGKNRNFAITYNMTSRSGTVNDEGANGGTSQVEFILCDDNMNLIPGATDEWKKPKLISNAITNTRNSKIWPQRDWYKLIDGRIITIIYDKLIVINGSNPNNPQVNVFVLDEDKWISTWTLDTNENIYFKSKNTSVIKKVTLPKSNNISISNYYDLSSSPIEKVKKYANTFDLYNVYGYSGQIMLINAYFKEWIPKVDEMPKEEEIKKDLLGLAVAITNNVNSTNSGDTKGLLNTNEAFQKSADFTITSEILNRKLPSEITRNDLDCLNSSFLTKNNIKNPNGTLKYVPFEKTEINDINKTFKIKVNLDQIPWFVTDGKMPSNIMPIEVIKSFTSNVDISTRVTWKDANYNYDFRNTLPSKLTVSDVEKMNLFIINLNSQKVVLDGQNYPKLEYSLKNQNDDTGKITIEAKYQYLPMDVSPYSYNLQTYTTSKDYTIFKKSDNKQFSFVGGDNSDISNIPELKELLESNILPSSYQELNNEEFLTFINTNTTTGYPISKMKISSVSNDDNGTLEVTIDPRGYDSTLSVISKTFTGFNKINEYSFMFNPNPSIDKNLFRPSNITNEIFYDRFIKYTGFDSSDMKLTLIPNDENGTLFASVKLVTEYAQKIIEKTPFKYDSLTEEYSANIIINGFKTTANFNDEFQLSFKISDDPKLIKAQELTPSEIINAFGDNNPTNKLIVDGKEYTNKYDFVNEIFVEKIGSKLPKISVDNKENIFINFFANNSGGEITVQIEFKDIDGYDTDLAFIQLFNGFSKGNDLITNDVLVFKNEMQLGQSLKDIYDQFPSTISKYLNENKKDIINFLNAYTNDYKTSIDKNNFELIVEPDDMYGTLIITIKFDKNDIKNSNSLLQYSQIYIGFQKY